MRMYDIIDKKKRGGSLTREEIEYFVNGYINENIPDYQVSALLMAIYYNGMEDDELVNMTDIMAHSGDMIDLSAINGIKVDKHSTGGVGDKTTLAVAPIVAACGGKVAKMSGRGLGFTGGTIDKLESIPGFRTTISEERFFDIVNDIGVSIIGQSSEIAPADKKIYALRDVTATVDSIPLIAASIMSKKLASGSDKIVLDVTVGSGAFMKNIDDAIILAQKMVAIGQGAGRQTVAYITNMNEPLGIATGNISEVIEAINTLKGKGTNDFNEICINFSASMLQLSGKGNIDECKLMAQSSIENGSALDKLAAMVKAQGGDERYIYDTSLFDKASYNHEWIAESDTYIINMDTERCGRTAVVLGAGREVKESSIDFTAGINFYKKTGDFVRKGEVIAKLYASDRDRLDAAVEYVKPAYTFGDKKVEKNKTIIAYVSEGKVIRY